MQATIICINRTLQINKMRIVNYSRIGTIQRLIVSVLILNDHIDHCLVYEICSILAEKHVTSRMKFKTYFLHE